MSLAVHSSHTPDPPTLPQEDIQTPDGFFGQMRMHSAIRWNVPTTHLPPAPEKLSTISTTISNTSDASNNYAATNTISFCVGLPYRYRQHTFEPHLGLVGLQEATTMAVTATGPVMTEDSRSGIVVSVYAGVEVTVDNRFVRRRHSREEGVQVLVTFVLQAIGVDHGG
nr:unnamed protein product [Spirometra erinaceieuropaei]